VVDHWRSTSYLLESLLASGPILAVVIIVVAE